MHIIIDHEMIDRSDNVKVPLPGDISRLENGDALLVCSDGLNDMVDDATIAGVLAEGQAPEATCARLVDSALAAGGRDNVTLVVARYAFPDEN